MFQPTIIISFDSLSIFMRGPLIRSPGDPLPPDTPDLLPRGVCNGARRQCGSTYLPAAVSPLPYHLHPQSTSFDVAGEAFYPKLCLLCLIWRVGKKLIPAIIAKEFEWKKIDEEFDWFAEFLCLIWRVGKNWFQL